MIRAIATIALLSACAARATAPVDDDNIPTLALLCPALQLADGEITFEPASPTKAADINDLLALNMSLADSTWQAKFKKPKPDKGNSGSTTTNKEATPGTEAEMAAWSTAADAINSKTKLDAVLKPYGYDSTNMSLLATAAQAIKHYTALAFDAQQQLAAATINDKPDTELKQALDKAIYGAAGSYNPAATAEAGLSSKVARQAACVETASTHNPIKTISTIVACVCAVKHDMGSGKAPCGPPGDQNIKWATSTGLPTAETWNKMRTRCPVLTASTITAIKVEAALNTAKQAFYGKGTDLYVGKYDSSGCDGSDNGACIKYSNQATTDIPKFDKAEWVGELTTIITALRARDKATERINALQNQIATAKVLVAAAARHPQSMSDRLTDTGGKTQKPEDDDTIKAAQKEIDCTSLDKETCKPDVGCKYNEKDSKCENDPVKTTTTKTNTNTTGSNSFVINKMPLFLAFLLLKLKNLEFNLEFIILF
uniref:Variant surface glycoprotein 603 n=1 Tax=Trypanosoma brucei TaxID=5691 RepID=M4T0F4_9TRYP|nr:variant surface glycoprotein 603 [Trypanosoma brucei]